MEDHQAHVEDYTPMHIQVALSDIFGKILCCDCCSSKSYIVCVGETLILKNPIH